MSRYRYALHKDWTGTTLAYWKPHREGLLVISDSGGYTSIHMTKAEWEQVKVKLDKIFECDTEGYRGEKE